MNGMRTSRARWNAVANQVMITDNAVMQNENMTFAMDTWGGYVAARTRLLEFLDEAKPSNPVFITGDIHSNWVADLKMNSRTVGTEFIGTSITSGGDGSDAIPAGLYESNPNVKYFHNRRGYVRVAVTPSKWTSDYRAMPYVSRRDAPIETRASFVVESGRPGAKRG